MAGSEVRYALYAFVLEWERHVGYSLNSTGNGSGIEVRLTQQENWGGQFIFCQALLEGCEQDNPGEEKNRLICKAVLVLTTPRYNCCAQILATCL